MPQEYKRRVRSPPVREQPRKASRLSFAASSLLSGRSEGKIATRSAISRDLVSSRSGERSLVSRGTKSAISTAAGVAGAAVAAGALHHTNGHHDHRLTAGPIPRFDKVTARRLFETARPRGALNSVLAVCQHGIKLFLAKNPHYKASLNRPGGRMIDLESLRQAISDFRQFLALGDLVGTYRDARTHHRNRANLTDFRNILGWIKLAGFAGYSLFEGMEWLASKRIYKAAKSDKKHTERCVTMLRISSWSYMVAIFATFTEILTGRDKLSLFRRLPSSLQRDSPKSRDWRSRRAQALRILLSATFWAPVCYDYGLKSQPLGPAVNAFFTMLAHSTKVQGVWAGSKEAAIKGPGLAGTLLAMPNTNRIGAGKRR